ncbi:MAG: hypothetical protein E8D41_07015 [Nitrospira sp.]|nr:MAG: hypothetical protein E8D41_07015 [Nitrospira sp.]
MLQNAAIDVTIALILMYLMLSLLCTVINEFIATKLKLRAKSLASAIEQLLDHQALRNAFYRHGLIVTNMRVTATGPQSTMSGVSSVASGVREMMISRPPAELSAQPATSSDTVTGPVVSVPVPMAPESHPSYLSSRSVALALIASLDPAKPLPVIQDIEDTVKNLPASRIRDVLLSSLTEAGTDVDKLRTSIATWYDDSMERLSGAYKRQLKWISMLVGLIVTIAFNADSFNVAITLWSDQDRRASIVAIATQVAQEPLSDVPEGVDKAKLYETINKTEDTLRSLPIGWNCSGISAAGASSAEQKSMRLDSWACAKKNLTALTLTQVLGWMFTATALTLGAPFWFDLLQKFVNVRGAGGRPKREDEKAK